MFLRKLALLCSVAGQEVALCLVSKTPCDEATKGSGLGVKVQSEGGKQDNLQEDPICQVDDGIRCLERWLNHDKGRQSLRAYKNP